MTVEALQKYTHRQVVLNVYEDDALSARDGFPFDRIEVTDTEVQFIWEDKCRYSINRALFPFFQVLPDFKNYFAVFHATTRIEIYFPE